MEPFYEYFYEIQGYSFTFAVPFFFFGPWLAFRLNKRRYIVRKYRESPFQLRLRAKINNTKLGKLNLKCHIFWENIRNKWAPRLILPTMSQFNYIYLPAALVSFFYGVLIGTFAGEISTEFRVDNFFYTNRNQTIFYDKSWVHLHTVKSKNYANQIIDWDLRNKINFESSQVLDFLLMGKLMSSAFQDELAYQCYYLAHLKDHENIGANSKMPWDQKG